MNTVTLPLELRPIAWDSGHRSPATPNWYINVTGEEIRKINEEDAVAMIEAGECVIMTYLNMYPAAPGLGIRAGRPNVASPIKDGLLMIWGQEIAYSGDRPAYYPVEKLPQKIAHECYHVVNAKWQAV